MTGKERAHQAQFLEVKDFEKTQHYKDRHPPWIKLYYSDLSDYEITQLPDAAQAQLFKLRLVASRHDNRIPYDLRFIRREIKPTGKLYIEELLASGLLAVCQQDASDLLASDKKNASTVLAPRARSRETEGNVVTPTQPVGASKSRALNGALERNEAELDDLNRRRVARGEKPLSYAEAFGGG